MVCKVPCSQRQQGAGLPAAGAASPDDDPTAAAGPQLVVVIGGFHGSSGRPSVTVSTQTPDSSSTASEAAGHGPARAASSFQSVSQSSISGSRFAEQADRAASAPAHATSPTQPAPRPSIFSRLLRRSAASSPPAPRSSAAADTVRSPQHRKVPRRLRSRPDSEADQPHRIGERPGATQYEHLTLSFSLVSCHVCQNLSALGKFS